MSDTDGRMVKNFVFDSLTKTDRCLTCGTEMECREGVDIYCPNGCPVWVAEAADTPRTADLRFWDAFSKAVDTLKFALDQWDLAEAEWKLSEEQCHLGSSLLERLKQDSTPATLAKVVTAARQCEDLMRAAREKAVFDWESVASERVAEVVGNLLLTTQDFARVLRHRRRELAVVLNATEVFRVARRMAGPPKTEAADRKMAVRLGEEIEAALKTLDDPQAAGPDNGPSA